MVLLGICCTPSFSSLETNHEKETGVLDRQIDFPSPSSENDLGKLSIQVAVHGILLQNAMITQPPPSNRTRSRFHISESGENVTVVSLPY